MNKPSDNSGSNTGLVIGIVALVLALPCCGGLVLVGAALLGFGFRSLERPRPAQPQVIVQPAPPVAPPAVEPEEIVTEEAVEEATPTELESPSPRVVD